MKEIISIQIKPAIYVVYMLVMFNSCSLLDPDPEEYDCYKIGRELTEGEKNIFPYKVGDSVFFTDGEKDYYISCERIVDTIYTVNENGDIYCEGEFDRDDEHIRYIAFNTDIPLYDSCKSLGVTTSPNSHLIHLYRITDYIRLDPNYQFSINTQRFVNTIKTNEDYDIYRLYVDSIEFNGKLYYDVYKLSSRNYPRIEHYLDTCYINKKYGFIQFELKNTKKIIRK